MGNKLYVGNVPFAATNETLTEHFSQAGTVTEVRIMIDRETGRSRGFAFVTMATDADAQNAINTLHGRPHEGRPLTITEARPREDRPPALGGGAAPRPPRREFSGGGGGGGTGSGGSGGGGGGVSGGRGFRDGPARRPERGSSERDRLERRERLERLERERGGRHESGGRRFQPEDYDDLE